MKKKLTACVLGALAVGCSTGAVQGGDSPSAPRVDVMLEAGYVAAVTCSGHFMAGRSLDQLKALELTTADGAPKTVAGEAPSIHIDRARKIVSVPFDDRLPPMRAAFRDGLGCTVLPWGATADVRDKLPVLSKTRPRYEKEGAAWPSDDWIKPATGAKAYEAALDVVVDRAFSREAYGAGARTISVLVVHQREAVAERYLDGFGPHTQYRTWSTAKSLASAVIGAAVQDGVFSGVDARAQVPEWSAPDDPRQSITLENLLHMASGLKTVLPEDGSNTPAAYWGGIDSAADAARRPLVHEPGETWHYSNYDTLLLMRSLKAALGDAQAYLDFPYARVFDRIGMHDTFAETDAYGNYVMSSQVFTTARDLARFGLLYLNDGVWKGDRVLPEGWAAYSCTQTTASAPLHTHYGAQWWMHDLDFDDETGIDDFRICTTSGGRGQHVAFSEEHGLVIVRQGIDESAGDGFAEVAFFKDVVRAIASERAPSTKGT